MQGKESTELEIFEARAGDREAVIALWRDAGLTRPWNDPVADFALALANSTSTVLIARDGSGAAGTVMVGFDGHRGWVYYLAIAEVRRRQGIARLLMQHGEGWLAVRGCPKAQLMVRGENAEALGFYAALGYEVQDVFTLGRRLDDR
jgi:ribosomal protein S18 acetylase RimI-like enzyme